MTEPTVMASMAASFLDYAVGRGVPRAALMQASGIEETVLLDPDGRVPVRSYGAMMGTAIGISGDTGIALRYAAETGLDKLSIIGLIIDAAGPLEDGIAQVNRYARIIADVEILSAPDRFELLKEAETLWLIDHFPNANASPTAIEQTFANFVVNFRRMMPGAVFLQGVYLTYPEPPHAALYTEVFRAPVTFGAERNALALDAGCLNGLNAAPKPYAFGLYTRHAEALLESLQKAESTRARVEAALLPDLHQGSASMDDVARDLGMSRQTLYRRLKDEGVTFAEVHDQLRCQMAQDYLTAQKASVMETAYLLGFSEASSFVRAFKRWTGQSPSAYRAAHP
ncbi:AraC family transcriptional regulator [Donghicola sp. XS_ASV15]|uniref:AraC family transcriptional regulator n=1 Tax=Donghicola sp. XS_ASV15 TaxID=3241295 RepID=UPI0035172FA4